MSSTIKPRRGTTAPTTGIVENELVVDTTNKRIYIGNIGGSGDLIGSAPGGSDTYIQFNDSGNFGGDVGLTYNKTTDAVTMLGDLNLNGGGIKTTQSSISIIPSTATTVSLGTAATSLTMGGASCTTTVNGGTLVGNLSAQNLFNTTATTLNIGGAATTLTVGGTTGTAAIRNPTIRLGNTTSSITTNSGTANSITLAPYGSVLITPTTSTSLGGTFASLVVTNSDSAAGQVQITGGDLYLGSKTDAGDVESPCNIIFEGVADANELTLTVDTLSGDKTITLPDANGTVAVLGTGSTTTGRIPYYDSTSKTLLGSSSLSYNTGTAVFTFDATVNVGGTLGTSNSTVNLLNTTATTINFGGAATSIIIGATTGTTQVRNDLQLNAQSDLRFADSDSSNYVAFQAPATVSSNVTWTLPSADGTSGQVLSTNGSGTLSWATASSGGGLTWTATTADATMAVDNGYLANKSSGTLTLTLPSTSAVGKVIRVSGMQNTWRVAQNASQKINFGKTTTTTGTGGYIESTNARDAVELVCCVANTEWNVVSAIGNITIV